MRRIAAVTAVIAGVLLLVSSFTAYADDAASGRLAAQGYSWKNAFWSVDWRITPRYVLLKHDPTPTAVGYFSLVVGAESGDDWKATFVQNPQVTGNFNLADVQANYDKRTTDYFSASIAFDDGQQVRMTAPSADAIAAGTTSARKPQPALGGSQGIEIRLPPEAKQIVRVEIYTYWIPVFEGTYNSIGAPNPYPPAGPAWPASPPGDLLVRQRPWVWPLNVAVAAGVVPGAVASAVVPGVVGGGIAAGAGGGSADANKPAAQDTGPGSPAYEGVLAAAAAMLAAWAALFGMSIGGALAPALDEDGLPLPVRPPAAGPATPMPPEEHWTSPLPPAPTDGTPPPAPVGEDGLPLPEPSKVKLAPKPEHWTTPQPPPEEHWTTPQPETATVDPAVAKAAPETIPHTVERDGTGGPRTAEPPVPVDPITPEMEAAQAEKYRRAVEEFQAAKVAYDANPQKGWEQKTTVRMSVARSELERTPESLKPRDRAYTTEEDRLADRQRQALANERQAIDNLPPDKRELASRGVVMAGQGDQTPADPSLAPTDVGEQGKWAMQMKDKIADLDQKIAATKNESGFTQAKLNQLTSARDAAAARLQIYRESNYDTEAVNIEDSNRAFGVMAKGTLKIVDLGTATAQQQAQGAFQGADAPVRMSDETKNLIAREYVEQMKPGVVSKVWDFISSPFRSGKPEPTEPNAGPPSSGAAGPKGEAPPPMAREPGPSAGPRSEPSPAVAPEPGPSGGLHDAPTKVDLPAAGSKPLPEGMVRNQYGEIVFTEPTPVQHATEIEVRNLNIDKHLGTGASPAYHGDYSKPMSEVRADDIAQLKRQGPEFWNSIQDPKQKLYLEQLRDTPSPGLQIDKSMGPAFHPAGPGDGLKQQLGGLVKGPGAPVDPKAPTVDVPSPGTPTQNLPHTGPGQTEVLPPGEPRGQVPPRGRP